MIARAGVAWGLVSMMGCAMFSPIPDTRTPLDRAREIEPKCRGESPDGAAAVLSKSAVESVEPYYVTVPSSSGHDNHMLGARVHVRPLPGVTGELLAHALQCHESAVVRGQVAAPEDDPYVLPGDWLVIDVSSEGDGFVVSTHPVDYVGGNEALARARRYAGARP